jgi:hypothetical protein
MSAPSVLASNCIVAIGRTGRLSVYDPGLTDLLRSYAECAAPV